MKAMLFSKTKNTGKQNLEMAMQSERSVGNVESVRSKLIEHGQRQSWKISNWTSCSFLEFRMKMEV